METAFMEFLDLFKTSFIFVVAIIAFTVQVVVFNDPPSFPLPNSYDDSIDCFNIISSSIKIEKSRLKVQMNIKDFIQYPIEVASSMVHIESNVGDVNFSFPSKDFWDLQSDQHHISFCALQTAAGHVEASLYCQNTLLSKTKSKITSLDAYPVGWSRLFDNQYFSSVYTDVCINSDLKLVFCSKQDAKIGDIRASYAEAIPVKITSQSASSYQQSQRIPSLEEFSVFVPYNSNSNKISTNLNNIPQANAQDFLFDTVLPIIGSLEYSPTAFLIPNKQILDQLSPILGYKSRLLSRSCHKKLSFLPTTGSYNVNQERNYQNYAQALSLHSKFIFSLKKSVFSNLKQIFSQNSSSASDNIRYDIVLDQVSSRLFESLQNSLSSYTIYIINDKQNFTSVASAICNAKVVVASDLKTLLFGALMTNESTLIEVSPDGMYCNSFKTILGPKFDVNYEVLPSKNQECDCDNSKDLTCYFEKPHKYEKVDTESLFQLIQNSLNN